MSPHLVGPRLASLLVAATGLVLLLGGSTLLALGGSAWYAVSGATLCASAACLWSGNRWGTRLYGGLLLATVVWSLWEVGPNAWGLLPRLAAPAVLGLALCMPIVQRGLRSGPAPLFGRMRSASSRRAFWIGLAALGTAAAVAVLIHGSRTERSAAGAATAVPAGPAVHTGPADWPHYGNDTQGTRYSDLAQITPVNVTSLELAWSFRTGDVGRPDQDYSFEVTPLKIGGRLYFCTPGGQAFALDAATGRLIWHFDPKSDLDGVTAFACRGVAFYSTGTPPGPCADRIYLPTLDARLWSLDASTGTPCARFGEHGAIDLRKGLGDAPKGMYTITSPPVVTRGRLVIGANVRDNASVDMPSGVVRAFDAVSGALAWAWDVGHPDRMGEPPPTESYTRSTPNAWAPPVADDALGLVYVPTGNPAADFWGRRRRAYDEQFGSSLVALDVDTGRPRWRFQATHHDLWDNDLPSQPVLVDLETAEGIRPAVVAGTKQGNLFILDRRSGAPIVPVTEMPAPGPSNLGERLSATQPASALSVNPGPARLTEAAMWGITPIDQMWCRIQFRRARYEGPYTPPGTGRASIVYPGMFGGIEWGGVSVDPVRQLLIANPSAMPFMVRIEPVGARGAPAGLRDMAGSGYAVSFFGFLSPLRVPCLQPPWGKLYAIDLRTLRVLWERAVGTAADSGPWGIASHAPLLIGTPQAGGTIVTRGGLIFAGATLDRYLRAYDLRTGEQRWAARLPAGGQATPITYLAGGRQFVVIAAGGHGVLGTRRGDYVLAYALPGS